MLLINKHSAPNSLISNVKRLRAGERTNSGSHQVQYRNLDSDVKHDIDAALLIEQGWLCAYCMSRITSATMHIEHYHAQHAGADDDDELSVRYDNMLAVCGGGEGNPRPQQTCDKHRGNEPLTVDPRREDHIRSITYKSDGTISSLNSDINKDLNVTLNLNMRQLKNDRAVALDTLKKQLLSHGSKKFIDMCRYYAQQYESQQKKTEYAGILLDYLHRKLQRQ